MNLAAIELTRRYGSEGVTAFSLHVGRNTRPWDGSVRSTG